jgi:hypothetical protein
VLQPCWGDTAEKPARLWSNLCRPSFSPSNHKPYTTRPSETEGIIYPHQTRSARSLASTALCNRQSVNRQPHPQPATTILTMADPLLSSLCRICNIQTPQYTCPRCSLQTCSLACSKRHKIWSSCNGQRDPTVFKPQSQLATPAGIDHDYNFLHSIEHRIERSEKAIVEDRGLVDRKELERARNGENSRPVKRSEAPGEAQIQRALTSMRTVVERAPRGMQRNQENKTSWSKNHKSIYWQVEWIFEDGGGRALGKAVGKTPIGDNYTSFVDQQKKLRMTDDEKRAEKKRKAVESKQSQSKKAKTDEATQDLTATPLLQDPQTATWSFAPAAPIPETAPQERAVYPTPASLSYHLYLLRPHTPSSLPKVLVPLDPAKPLDHHLQRRVVLEFPTIYVLTSPPEELPTKFMLEKDYLAGMGHTVSTGGARLFVEEIGSSGEDGTSSSGSDKDEEMEDGEIVS